MALVSISEAAKLVRRNRSTIYRDIERGRLSKTVSPDGEAQIDTSELLRTYGRLHLPDDDADDGQSRDQLRIALLEERNRSLERALALEAELRKVKDQVTNELRARIADKESVIKVLESKVLFLEYDRQVESMKRQPEAEPPQAAEPPVAENGPARPAQAEAVPAPTPAPAPVPDQPQAATEAAASPMVTAAPPEEMNGAKQAEPTEDNPGIDRSRVKVFHTDMPRDLVPPHVPKMETMPPAEPPQAAPPKQRWWKMLIDKKKKPPLHK
ncbi:hypothetical protein [Noviherbaspirillum malthae]|jgi:hypothetical protein|uniref:hypothetical protein n=1 Tax=Noviherbaspirillum malthae TaxID=1260987 RepID=UPI00188FA7AB|nr:hypothetical protein [Noviherbaspirillum malthae]